jgi:hypothetical protein
MARRVTIALKATVLLEVTAESGESYWVRACELSKKQPFCERSNVHTKGPGFLRSTIGPLNGFELVLWLQSKSMPPDPRWEPESACDFEERVALAYSLIQQA